jgi:Na+/H+ antiporter NhaD/arsenite permease-like protein
MDPVVLAVFLVVYAGMIAGGFPRLALDRTGVALLGAIALLASGKVSPEAARDAVDVTTIALLFGLMVVSAQFRLGGFYTRITERIASAPAGPVALLGMLIAVSGLLSAILANDIVCLAVAPILAAACARRSLDPVPFLLGLACASNVGSAATLIGNPQNMLIGQTLRMSFGGYLLEAAVPCVLGLAATWGILAFLYQGRFRRELVVPEPESPSFSAWQTGKGAVVTGALMVLFVATPWPREILALCAAAVLLLSRHMASRKMLALVDWQLLVLFVALFVVNHALAASGMLSSAMGALAGVGIDPREPAVLFGGTVVLSNLVSNVPATMLLLPAAVHPQAGAILALSSTLAGNLIIVGSIANIIVVEQAGRLGVRVSWAAHARVGIPVTVATLAIAAVWLSIV